MSSPPDLATCISTEDGRGELLPLSPFNSLRFNFGMLLGVDDFETEQAYHRAKMRLHNAWLHRAGAVWGFGVAVDKERGEIRVSSGLALDAAGRELHLEDEACVNVGEWFNKHEQDPDFEPEVSGETRTFNTHVVIRFKACLTRQVPALSEPCENSGSGTAYSRVHETLEILMLPNAAPARTYPYHRLRLLFGLEEARKKPNSNDITDEDQAVLDEVARIRALSAGQQAEWLKAFQLFSALDEIELRPATSEDGSQQFLFPGRDDEHVVLADIAELKITKSSDGWVVDGGTVDTSVRPTHIATTTIQDLLCGTLGVASLTGVGPRVDPSAVTIDDNQVTLKTDQPLEPASVKTDAFSVSVFDATAGWTTINVTAALDAGGQTITLTAATPPIPNGLTRVIARGTGPAPLLGTNKLPVSGATNLAPTSEGADFVLMKERS